MPMSLPMCPLTKRLASRRGRTLALERALSGPARRHSRCSHAGHGDGPDMFPNGPLRQHDGLCQAADFFAGVFSFLTTGTGVEDTPLLSVILASASAVTSFRPWAAS
jgi:hypothetical protein